MCDGAMVDSNSLSIWEKIDIEEYKAGRAAALPQSAPIDADSTPQDGRWRWVQNRAFWTALNVVAAIFWLYLPLKLFVGEVDHWIFARLAPTRLWILDYRFFILLIVFTIIVIVAKRLTLVIILYIAFYPIVVLFWKIPRFYYRSQSWNLVIGSIQVVWSLGKSIRFTLIAVTVFAVAALAVARESSDQLLSAAAAALLMLWFWLVFRALVYAFHPSKFMTYQQGIVDAILSSDTVWKSLVALPATAKSEAVMRLEKSQIDQLVNNASMGLVFYGGGALWAEKLDQYRKTGASVVFSAIAVALLVAEAVGIFALVNLALYRIDPSEFAFTIEPTLAVFVRYTLSSMYFGEIEALRPAGTWSNWVSVLSGLSCAVVLFVLIVSVTFSWKQTRDDRVAEEAIHAMRKNADAYAEKLAREYGLPLTDVLGRVLELGGILTVWVRWSAAIVEVIRKRAKARE